MAAVLTALATVDPMTVERLLGALELAVADLDHDGGPLITPDPAWFEDRVTATLRTGRESQAVIAANTLEQVYPGLAEPILELARRLSVHPEIADLLKVSPDLTGEAEIVAAHGRAYLALAVATAAAVVGQLPPPEANDRTEGTVGLGLGVAALLLREVPPPAAHAAAVLARFRAEYLLPRFAYGSVPVADHRFALLEHDRFPPPVDFGDNGLVAAVDGGAVIRTGQAEGVITVRFTVLDQPPPPVEPGWDDVVEISWTAAGGAASLIGPNEPGDPQLLRQTPPWPGDYRLRVHASGRDDADDDESYELVVWSAPAGPAIVHRQTDRLGHRLRGEPPPAPDDRPERAYRWVRHSRLADAATVTVVTGSTALDVLRAFGADPARPQSLKAIEDNLMERMSLDPWVTVLEIEHPGGPIVPAVEFNGWQGSQEEVLRRAGAGGRAASMYWNVNALTRLSFAEHGQIVAAFEPMGVADVEPAVASLLAGIDFADYRDTIGKGLAAVERFTGHTLTPEDLSRIEAADTGFRISGDIT